MAGQASRAARELARENPGLLPGLALVGVLTIWADRDGGHAMVDWAPGGLFVLALTVVVLGLAAGSVRRTGPVTLAIVFLAGYTGWSYATTAWAEVPASAWAGANKTLLYLVVFVLVAALPWRSVGAAIMLGAYAVGVWAVSMVSIGRAADLPDVTLAFTEGRLAVPISYANASCALFVSAVLPALHLASRREVPTVLRGVLLAVAGTLVQLVVLAQSRASLAFLPLIALLYVAVVPGRIRSVIGLVVIAATAAATAPWHLDVYQAVLSETDARAVLERSLVVLLVSAFALLATGVGWGWLDSRVDVSPRVAAFSGRALTGASAALVLVVVVVAAASVSNPGARASAAWDHFRNEDYVSDPNTPHLTSGFGSGRWKIWSVAVDQFERRPVIGVGVDNFGVDYLRQRRDQAQPIYPHSVELRVLSQTGIVGASLLLGFLVSAGWAVRTRYRGGQPWERGVVGVAGLGFAYWLIHGSIDWFWEIPALSAPAFAFLALAIRVDDSPRRWVGSRRALPKLAFTAVGVAALVAAVSVGLPWLSSRETNAAIAQWRSDPRGAFDRLERARTLNPLTDEPDVVAAVIASQLGDERRQEDALLDALDRNPTNWYPMVELAALETRRSRDERAESWLERAEALNPREPTIAFIRQQIGLGRSVSSDALQRMWIDQASLLTGRRQRW